MEGPPDAGSTLPHIDYGPDLENGGFSTRGQFHTHLLGPAGADWTEPATGARGVRPGRTAPGEDRIRSGSGVNCPRLQWRRCPRSQWRRRDGSQDGIMVRPGLVRPGGAARSCRVGKTSGRPARDGLGEVDS